MANYNRQSSSTDIKLNPTTPIQFFVKDSSYVQGQGTKNQWTLLESDIYKIFYCEWKNTYGDRAISAEALGIKESATIRIFYNPVIYEKLRSVQVIIVKNADDTAFVDSEPNKNNPNVYEHWGGVDNVLERNQLMEFRVRRYEGL